MKKDSFLKGAVMATFCIVFSKILGIIYVIPFHAIIGTNGRALYSYAYNMYMLFLNFSTVGIPLAISKIVSEYHALGYEDTKKRAYRIALKIIFAMSILSTIALLLLAPTIANTIIGDVKGGNTIEDITYVLRVSASAILFVTMLSGVRGYLQGHKYITPSSISQVIEQLVRVIIIILGSYIAVKLFGTKEAVGVAIFGATAGAIVALIYLELKMRKQLKSEENIQVKEEEKQVTNKYLAKKLLEYTVPFIIVSVAVSLYNTIDMLSIVKPLMKYGHLAIQDAEMVLSIISTWGAKLNSIVTSIAAGVVVAVLPNITSDFVKKNYKEVDKKINKTIQMVLYFVMPMVIGLSFLAEPVWYLFYGKSPLGVKVFSYSIFTAIFYSLFLNIHTILQSVGHHKAANRAIIFGLVTKLCLTVPLIILFSKTTIIPAYYGSITATILAYITSIVISLIDIKKNLNVSFKTTKEKLYKITFSSLFMLVVLFLIKLFIPLSGGKVYSLIIVVLYALIGGIIYFVLTSKMHIFEDIFECTFMDFINKILKRKKVAKNNNEEKESK